MTSKLLCVQFDTPIEAREVPLFRGAVVQKVGREHDLFHNHKDAKEYLYRYPLIQYKRLYGKASIVCMGQGVEEIHKLFEKQDWTLRIGEREAKMPIHRLDLRQFDMGVREKMQAYYIRDWIALNQQNYAVYMDLPTQEAQIAFLEKRLIGHILGFAEAIGWQIEAEIKVQIDTNFQTNTIPMKDQKLIGFRFQFLTNVFLPHHIGLGGKVALGNGIISGVKK